MKPYSGKLLTSPNYDYIFKILLVGASGVGKTQLLQRYTSNQFSAESETTIGIDLSMRDVNLSNGRIARLQIWDTAGQERFRAIVPSYYNKALGVLLVYDIGNKQTFEACNHFIDQIEHYADPRVTVFLIGNKADLDQKRKISLDEITTLADKYNYLYSETSALSGQNVDGAFTMIAEEIFRKVGKSLERNLANTDVKPLQQVFLNVSSKQRSSTCC